MTDICPLSSVLEQKFEDHAVFRCRYFFAFKQLLISRDNSHHSRSFSNLKETSNVLKHSETVAMNVCPRRSAAKVHRLPYFQQNFIFRFSTLVYAFVFKTITTDFSTYSLSLSHLQISLSSGSRHRAEVTFCAGQKR